MHTKSLGSSLKNTQAGRHVAKDIQKKKSRNKILHRF